MISEIILLFSTFGLCRCIQENGRSKENNDGTYYARPFTTKHNPIPDNKDIADKFEELISPIFKQIVKLQEKISNFIKQRDELLPLLMNGQITIE